MPLFLHWLSHVPLIDICSGVGRRHFAQRGRFDGPSVDPQILSVHHVHHIFPCTRYGSKPPFYSPVMGSHWVPSCSSSFSRHHLTLTQLSTSLVCCYYYDSEGSHLTLTLFFPPTLTVCVLVCVWRTVTPCLSFDFLLGLSRLRPPPLVLFEFLSFFFRLFLLLLLSSLTCGANNC